LELQGRRLEMEKLRGLTWGKHPENIGKNMTNMGKT
jgi:hypothetical protein